jgi:hypothetical protein
MQEREKKARKKEKRKVGAVEATDGGNEGESAPSSVSPTETPKESETGEKALPVTKRSQRASAVREGCSHGCGSSLRHWLFLPCFWWGTAASLLILGCCNGLVSEYYLNTSY